MQPTSAERRDTLMVTAVIVSLLALFGTVVGIGLGARAIDQSKKTSGSDTKAMTMSASAPKAVDVTLKEFAIAPAAITVPAGGSLAITNAGTIEHNVKIDGTSVATANIPAGGKASLDLASLKAGSYTVICGVSGHKEAGMKASLTVSGSGGSDTAAATDTSTKTMSVAEMDAVMAKNTKAFPAKTEGLGGQLLTPNVLPDGTKEFDLTTKVVDWEISPGKKVKAWTYNGVVPGPTIKVNVGDKVKVVLKNELPESTSIHFHGLRTPNAMDGVPDITQPPVDPGKSFSYEFTAQGPAVGMYHSHQNAVVQVPNGLAGAFIIGDEPIPAGMGAPTQEIPMMLNDSGTLGLTLNGKSFPATAPVVAKLGEWIEVHYMNEGVMIHPMHLHGIDQIVIAKDGHPLANPSVEDTVLVAPGERYTVLIHADVPGVWAWHCHILNHAESSDGMVGMVTALIVK